MQPPFGMRIVSEPLSSSHLELAAILPAMKSVQVNELALQELTFINDLSDSPRTAKADEKIAN
jgi:hypothetical protein